MKAEFEDGCGQRTREVVPVYSSAAVIVFTFICPSVDRLFNRNSFLTFLVEVIKLYRFVVEIKMKAHTFTAHLHLPVVCHCPGTFKSQFVDVLDRPCYFNPGNVNVICSF